MTIDDYKELVNSLDVAMGVYIRLGSTEEQAKDALLDFVSNHFFEVWRKMK